jgi:hypothetical protein
MSSVQSFLRQRQTGQTMLSGPNTTNTLTYFSFVASPGNYVGNYTPGVMVDATANVAGLLNTYGVTGAPVLRDMGKTIKATVVTSGNVPNTTATPGFFREVQVLVPSTVQFPTSSTNNGVIGQLPGSLPSAGNAGDAGYATFYIPIVVGGVVASNATGGAPLAISAAGLMVGEQL